MLAHARRKPAHRGNIAKLPLLRQRQAQGPLNDDQSRLQPWTGGVMLEGLVGRHHRPNGTVFLIVRGTAKFPKARALLRPVAA